MKATKPVLWAVFLSLHVVSFLGARPTQRPIDVEVLSCSVDGVKLHRSVEGKMINDWMVRVFLRNTGTTPLEGVDVSLTVWRGRTVALPEAQRFIRKQRHSTFKVKGVGRLAPGQTLSVVFPVSTSSKRQTLLLGALADCGEPRPELTVARVRKGQWKGSVREGNEGNNYREIRETR